MRRMMNTVAVLSVVILVAMIFIYIFACWFEDRYFGSGSSGERRGALSAESKYGRVADRGFEADSLRDREE